MAQIIDMAQARDAQLLAAYAKPATTYEEMVARDAMVTRLSCAETAKLVRAALKAAFPGQKFSVKSSVYSGGASIDVTWTDGPTAQEVDAITKRYERSTFDGMTDSRTYHGPTVLDGKLVKFGADHVMSQRTVSYDLLVQSAQTIAREYGVPAPTVKQSTSTWGGKTHTSAWIERGGEPLDRYADGRVANYCSTAADKALALAYATSCYTAPTTTPEPPTTPPQAPEPTAEPTLDEDAPYTCPFCQRVTEPVTCEACDGLACDDCLSQQYNADCGYLCVCPKCAGVDDEPPTPPQGPSVYERNADLYDAAQDKTAQSEARDEAQDVPEGAAVLRRDLTSHMLWLEFDGKPDEATRATLKADGWRWSGYRKQWHTNRRFAQVPAGIPHVDAGECDYASERADRLSARAEKHAAKSSAAYQKSHDAVAHIPFGQPILVGHHSEGRHRRDLARSWAAMDKSVAEANVAERLQDAARSSARTQARKLDVGAMQRRADRLSADLRAMQRRPWTGAQAQEWQRRVDSLTAEIADLQQRIAAAGGIKADQLAAAGMAAQVGDTVRIHGFVGVIQRVNPKTYTVKMSRDSWTLKLDKTRLQEIIARRGDGASDA